MSKKFVQSTKTESVESENGLIGSLMHEPKRTMRFCTDYDLTKSCFVNPANGLIFESVEIMLKESLPVDLLTVGRYMDSKYPRAGHSWCSELEDRYLKTPTSAYAESYVSVVKDCYLLREINDLSYSAIEMCSSGDKTVSEIKTSITKSISDLPKDSEDGVTDESIIKHHIDAMNGNPNSIPLPFDGMTRRTGGLRKGMVTVFTGRSKSGKSMFKSFWCRYLAERGIPVLDMCFEDKEDVSRKRCASIGRYSISELDAGGKFFRSDASHKWVPTDPKTIELERVSLAYLRDIPVYFDGRKCSVSQLDERIHRHVESAGIQIVFIDGAKDMKRAANQHNDCGFEESVSQAFTEIAAKHNISVVPIHHLIKIDPNALIHEADIRGSGNIVSDARAIYALQSSGLESYTFAKPTMNYDEDGYLTTRVFECLANNHGKSGRITLESDLDRCDFRPVY
jgi:replicative DNA helicase